MRRGFGRNSHQDDEEGNQGCVQGYMADGWQQLAVAIEEKGKNVDDLIPHKDMPWMDHAGHLFSTSHRTAKVTYKSG